MSLLLFSIYLIAACFFISRSRFIKSTGLDTKTVLILFILKIAAGCFVGLVNHFLFNNNTDYDILNGQGIDEHATLINDPSRFFMEIFKSNYEKYGEFFGAERSYWNDLRTNISAKLLAVLNIFSRGDYFINSLFLNIASFFGLVALYRVFIHIFPAKKIAVIIGCFLLPSTLYFSSGVHKDLLVLMSLCFFSYAVYFSLKSSFTIKRIVLLVLSVFCIFLMRNFILPFLLPFAGAWVISKKYSLKPAVVFGTVMLLMFAGTAFAHFFFPKYDPLAIVAQKQHAFLSMPKGTLQYSHADSLETSFSDFAAETPEALRHAFVSPYPGEFDNIPADLFAAEITGYLLSFLFMLIFYERSSVATDRPFLYFAVFFSFIAFLFNGYITPNAGALIRYRSIYLPFILTPVFCRINTQKFKKYKILK